MTEPCPDVLDVLVIGTGFSGIGCGIKLLEKGITNFRIVEQSQGIGGTWWENTYPGAACDVPSHFYCYSFEPNPNWSRVYSPQAEIQQYIERCVDKYGVRPYLQHGMKVLELRLDESRGVWMARFEDGSRLAARHVINGAGGLHRPSWPDIPGRRAFTGASMHTAQWDHAVDFTNRNVAVIGSAASAIQLVPELARVAKTLMVYQRTANYIAPRNDRGFSDKEKARFARWPWLMRLYRWFIFTRLDLLLFPITRGDSIRSRIMTRHVKKHMRASVTDPELREQLVPDYEMGCKRILISDNFFDALNRENVEVVTTPIENIEAQGVRSSDGALRHADILVYATGFDIEAHMESLSVVGLAGRKLRDDWAAGAEAYNGACVAAYPNYYLVTGPNTGVGTTSVVYMIEQELDYILRLIERAGDRLLVSVRQSAQDSYNARIRTKLGQSVWASGCKSWYRRPDGKITVLYPDNARAFRRLLKNVHLNDFEWAEIGERRDKS